MKLRERRRFAQLSFIGQGPRRRAQTGIHCEHRPRYFLRVHWPKALRSSKLLREADVLLFSTGDPFHNSEMKSTFVSNPNFAIINRDNPGYQPGANLAMAVGVEQGLFAGYEWMLRVNPDVLVLNDSWILRTMEDPNVDGIFVDCKDLCHIGSCTNPASVLHTDFFPVRPRVLKHGAFNESTFAQLSKAEFVATYEFQCILSSGRHRWLPRTGPMRGRCRVRGKGSPVIHSHNFTDAFFD